MEAIFYNISYHLTPQDASTPLNPISLTVPYSNILAFVQFLHVRAEDPNTGCFTVIQIELNVDPAPVMPTTLPVIANCGAGNVQHIQNALYAGASAVCLGSMVVYQKKGMGVLINMPEIDK